MKLEIGEYVYGARIYDPQLGRWHNIDPSAENYMPVSPYSYALNNPVLIIDNYGRDVFIYYVGPQRKWYNAPAYYLLGHTAIGVKPVGSERTWYHPTSGNIAVIEMLDEPDPYIAWTRVINEEKTIFEYAKSGEVVVKMRIKLPDKVEKILADYVSNGANGKTVGGLYCTRQVYFMLLQAFLDSGYSEKEAKRAVRKILWYDTPEYPTEEEMRDAGFYGFDLYFKDEKTGEVKQINARFGNDTKNENAEENKRKTEGFNNLMNNFSNLESGTYIWNGSSWVKQ